MNDFYLTIKETATGNFKDRQSKFFAYAFPVSFEEDIKSIIKDLRKKHYDANHLPYAYVLGTEKKVQFCSDDGEPHNSSGPSILNVLKSKELTNILIVVVRYFGGTKLGIPGLMNAFKTATEDVLQNCVIEKKVIVQKIKIEFEYLQMNDIMSICKKYSLEITLQNFEQICTFEINIPKKIVDEIYDLIKPHAKNIDII
jgi:uncharacterized YigZ family protein